MNRLVENIICLISGLVLLVVGISDLFYSYEAFDYVLNVIAIIAGLVATVLSVKAIISKNDLYYGIMAFPLIIYGVCLIIHDYSGFNGTVIFLHGFCYVAAILIIISFVLKSKMRYLIQGLAAVLMLSTHIFYLGEILPYFELFIENYVGITHFLFELGAIFLYIGIMIVNFKEIFKSNLIIEEKRILNASYR